MKDGEKVVNGGEKTVMLEVEKEIMCNYNPIKANKFENPNEIYQFVKR